MYQRCYSRFAVTVQSRHCAWLAGLLAATLLAGCSSKFEPHNAREELLRVSSWSGPAIDVVTYRPPEWRPDMPVVIVLHGINRNLSYTLETWEPLADRYGFMVVVPHFGDRDFPGSFGYGQGSVRDGRVPPDSAYNAIAPVFAEVRQRYHLTREGYRLFGHSAGAQFVHRFLYFHPDAPVERAVISMAGWYTLPDLRADWPYGLNGTAVSNADLRRIMALDVVLQVGSQDRQRDENLRASHEADAQGRNRVARGFNYYEMMQDRANALGSPFNWRFVIVPEAGHDSEAGADDAAPWLAAGFSQAAGQPGQKVRPAPARRW
jgi:hypothetical protein